MTTVDESGTSVATRPADGAVTSSRSGKRSRFGSYLVAAVVMALGGGAAGYAFFADRDQAPAEQHAASQGAEQATVGMPVEVAMPHAGGVERVTTQAGSVHAFYHATLFAKVSGYLKFQNVDIGDHVTVGQLLAVIDDPEVDKAVDQNQAALDQALARVKVAEARVRSAQAAKEAAEAMVKVSEATVSAKVSNEDLERKQLTRIAGLVARNAIEAKLEDEQKDRFDVATSEVGVSRAGVLSARAEVISKEARIEEAQADLAEAKANVEVAQANLGKAKVIQEYTRITSPYDGVVTLRSFHPGNFIRSASEGGNEPVLAVAATDKMRVVLPIPDEFVPMLNKGDQATVEIVAIRGHQFTGEVSRFSNIEDSESRNMRTEVDLPNPDGLLREGMFGRVTVVLQAASPQSVTIPSSGLIGQTGTGAGGVYVVKDGKAHKVAVQVGNDNGVETEILKGLTPEDQVIVTYNGAIKDGTPVKAELRKTAAPSTGH
jgi:HlyD family secretion protein